MERIKRGPGPLDPSVSLVSRVLPDGIAGVETWTDDHEVALFPVEEAYIAGATPSRRREFATVRWCARRALTELGGPDGPLVPAAGAEALGRHPIWPRGYTGSMTHCDGYRAAAVADSTQVAALGIDAEPHGSLPSPALDRIAGAAERRHLHELRRQFPEIAWDRVIFSAKESVFKAWFPRTHRWFDFRDCAITIDPVDATFTADLELVRQEGMTTSPTAVIGRWAVSGAHAAGHIVTSAVMQ